jgi:hypothetical protein
VRTIVAGLALVAALTLALMGWQWYDARETERLRVDAQETAIAFLTAWVRGEEGLLDALAAEGTPAADREEVSNRLEVDSWTLLPQPATLVDGDRARLPFGVSVELAGLGEWSYPSELELAREGEEWRVVWSRSSLHPDLDDGRALDRGRWWHERAPILDRHGEVLSAEGTSLGLVVGSVGEITAELIEEFGARYLEGDEGGTGGLQRAFERRLAGDPAGEVVLVDGDGETLEVLYRFEGAEGGPVRTTLDPEVQAAADAVLDGDPAAIVAIDPARGAVLAAASHPADDWNRAMSSRYPPGSTFKIVTAGALLRDGMAPDDPIDCPETRDIGGWTFHNFEDMDLGAIDLATATYESCNTAYVRMAADVDDEVLVTTAEDFGFNVDYDLPIGARGGVFPPWDNVVVKAAAGFGQGQVESSPLHLASVAAAITDGTWRRPVLITDPTEAETVERDVSDVAPTLAELMELVVSRGTAADAGLPADVAGKTGTAEWGEPDEDDELPTHAWFIGYAPWDDPAGEVDEIAFAVIVEGGEAGGRVAAPLTARFLAELRG